MTAVNIACDGLWDPRVPNVEPASKSEVSAHSPAALIQNNSNGNVGKLEKWGQSCHTQNISRPTSRKGSPTLAAHVWTKVPISLSQERRGEEQIWIQRPLGLNQCS